MEAADILTKVMAQSGWGNFVKVHDYVLSRLSKDAIVIELGVASGRGLGVLATIAKKCGIKRVYGIDHFLGTAGESRDFYFNETDGISKANAIGSLAAAGVDEGDYEIIVGDTVESAKFFERADYVFLDADHSFHGVTRDIAAWWPKISVGGFIGGHDWLFQTVQEAVRRTFPNPLIIDDCWLAVKHRT